MKQIPVFVYRSQWVSAFKKILLQIFQRKKFDSFAFFFISLSLSFSDKSTRAHTQTLFLVSWLSVPSSTHTLTVATSRWASSHTHTRHTSSPHLRFPLSPPSLSLSLSLSLSRSECRKEQRIKVIVANFTVSLRKSSERWWYLWRTWDQRNGREVVGVG